MDALPPSTSAPSSPRAIPAVASIPAPRAGSRPSSVDSKASRASNRPTMTLNINASNAASNEGEESFTEWLDRYRRGRAGPSDAVPEPPAAILAILEGREDLQAQPTSPAASTGSNSPSAPAYASSPSSGSSTSLPSLHSLTAATLLDFYRRRGHFPAPPGPFEDERLRLAHRFGLDVPKRRRAVDRICDLARRYFKTTSVVISLTFDDHQVLGAERGWGGEEPGLDVPPRRLEMSPAFCTHAMLSSYRDPKAVFIVSDADKDWRFKKNPYTVGNGGGLAFYAAANVNLPVPESDRQSAPDLPSSLASGALCLIDSVPRAPDDFSEEDRQVLADFAEMISREFQLGFEQRRREQESQQGDFVGRFLHQALVLPSQPGDLKQAVSESESPPSTPPSATSEVPGPLSGDRTASASSPQKKPAKSMRPKSKQGRDDDKQEDHESLFALAARELKTLTHAGSAAIFDLRSFRPSTTPSFLSAYQSHVAARHGAPSSALTPTPATAFASPSLAAALGAPFSFDKPASAPDKHATRNSNSVPRRESLNSQFWRQATPSPSGRGRVSLMGADGDIPWAELLRRRMQQRRKKMRSEEGEDGSATDEASASEGEQGAGSRKVEQAVEDLLKAYSEESPETPEESTLDATAFIAQGIIPATKATSSICIPIFDVDRAPAVLIVLTSAERWFGFEPTDRRFAQSVGAIVVGSLLRQRALAADRAKLAFVSQVSHELRTPLHGCASQIELMREFATPRELKKFLPLLDTAEVCLESLRDVLDDTLDFSKLSNAPIDTVEHQRRSYAPADLEAVVEGVLQSTWVRKQRSDLVNLDSKKTSPTDKKGKVDLIVDVEQRRGGWGVMVDIGGLKRVLLNLVGNSVKFTKEGEVKLTLRELGIIPSSSRNRDKTTRIVSITVRDTGCGMSADFLKNGSHLLPFVQADPFAPGAGLGLSICDTIIKRMGGKLDVVSELGRGTQMTVTLPLDFDNASSPTSDQSPFLPRVKRRIISDELAALLQPGPKHILTPSTEEGPFVFDNHDGTPTHSTSSPLPRELDFASALSAAQASFVPQLPSRGPPPSPGAGPISSPPLRSPGHPSIRIRGTKADPNDLVDEAAKLSLSSSPSMATPLDQPPVPANGQPGVVRKSSLSRSQSVAPDVRVLFADDNPIAKNILVKLFSNKGIDFAAADDGQEAVELFEAGGGTFSLFLADVQMPRMDGIQASAAIREIEAERGWKPCRILALTGLSNESDMQKALGADGPVDQWMVKGGKSLRVILDEVAELQKQALAAKAT